MINTVDERNTGDVSMVCRTEANDERFVFARRFDVFEGSINCFGSTECIADLDIPPIKTCF